MGEVPIGLGDLFRQKQSVFVQTFRLAESLEGIGPQHFAERVRGIDRAIDKHVRHVNALRGKLSIQRLAEHPTPAHGGGVGVLAFVTAHRSRGRSHQQGAIPALDHFREQAGGHTEQRERCHAPAEFKLLIGRITKGAIADLGAQIKEAHVDGPDIPFDLVDQVFDGVVFNCVEKAACCLAARGLDPVDHGVEPLPVAATAKDRMIAAAGKTLARRAANPGPGADDQKDFLWIAQAGPLMQRDPDWHVVTGFFPSTDFSVNACVRQTIGNLGAEQ